MVATLGDFKFIFVLKLLSVLLDQNFLNRWEFAVLQYSLSEYHFFENFPSIFEDCISEAVYLGNGGGYLARVEVTVAKTHALVS